MGVEYVPTNMSSGANRIYFQNKEYYNKAREDVQYLGASKVLSPEAVKEALTKLEAAWHDFMEKYEQYIPLNHELLAPLPPPINRFNRRGIIAFREWLLRIDEGTPANGGLRPITFSSHCEWGKVMYADQVPTTSNSNGLYARKLVPELITSYSHYGQNQSAPVWGFVELTGRIQEHGDGVYRAERAEVIALYVTVHNEGIHSKLSMGALKSLTEQFFPVPVYPVVLGQVELIMMREILREAGVSTY